MKGGRWALVGQTASLVYLVKDLRFLQRMQAAPVVDPSVLTGFSQQAQQLQASRNKSRMLDRHVAMQRGEITELERLLVALYAAALSGTPVGKVIIESHTRPVDAVSMLQAQLAAKDLQLQQKAARLGVLQTAYAEVKHELVSTRAKTDRSNASLAIAQKNLLKIGRLLLQYKLMLKRNSAGQAPKALLATAADSNAAPLDQLIKAAMQPMRRSGTFSQISQHAEFSSNLTDAISLPSQPAQEMLHSPNAIAAVQQSLSLLQIASSDPLLFMQPSEQSPADVQLGENGLTTALKTNLLGLVLQYISSAPSRHTKPHDVHSPSPMQPGHTGFSTVVKPNTLGALLTGSTSLAEICKPGWDTDPEAFGRFPKPEPRNARWPGGWLRHIMGYQEPLPDIPSRL